MRVGAYGTQPDFFIGWFAGSGNRGLIFTNDSNKAAMMHTDNWSTFKSSKSYQTLTLTVG